MSDIQILFASAKYAGHRLLRYLGLSVLGGLVLLGGAKMITVAKGAAPPAEITFVCFPVSGVVAGIIALGADIIGEEAFSSSPTDPRHQMLLDNGIWIENYDLVTVLRKGNEVTIIFSLATCMIAAVKMVDDGLPSFDLGPPAIRGTPS